MQVTPTIHFAEEHLSWERFRELGPLLEAHYKEIAHYQDIPLAPDWNAYLTATEQGRVRFYTFREAGVLAGYGVYFVQKNVHYSTSLQAVQDVIWLAPAYRKQQLGARFIDYCDAELRKVGVMVVYHHVKHSLDFGPTLQRLGYESIETIWGRRLDKE